MDDQVDTIDLFRFKNLSSGENALPRRVVSIPNSAAALGGNDLISDAAAEVNETLDFEHFQPFPVSDLPHSGTCEVSGVLVHRLSGDPFNIHWQAGSQVLINGVAYTLFAPPIDTDTLELTESAGAFNSTSFSVPEATLGGQSMPCLWGPDPLTGVVFACGHPLMGGTLSWTRPYDADTLEITSPSEPLMNGFMYDGRSYVYTTERLFLLYAQRITDPNGNPRLQYAAQEVPNHKGLSCRYASAVGDLFWAVNKDGVYQQSEAITTEGLHPLFPHQGEVGVETNGYKPIDFTKPNEIRLFFTKGALYLLYKDTDNVRQMMVYDRKLSQPGWFPRTFQVIPLCVYEEEGQVPPLPTSPPRTLLGAGGPIVPDTPIAFDFITRAEDMADPRLQKLFLDHMIDLDPKQGITITPHILFNNLTVDLPFAPAVIAGLRQQIPISQLPGTDLSLYRNAALKLISQYDPNTHTPPVFYEYEPNAVLQPYLARVMSSPNFITLGFTTYGHLRDSYWCWISTSPITVVIKAKDLDNEYTYTFPIPSSSGKVRKQYFPLKALKGLVFYFSADAASPFALFTEETIVRAKEWGSNAAFISAKPFQGQSR